MDRLVDSYKHRGLRKKLVDTIKQKGIKDSRVLEAINNVPRHFFLDSAFAEQAYKDIAFPIGQGQTISQPYTVALQTTLLELEAGDKVLEIGTGSGYQCCVLLEMQAHVYTIESNRFLYEKVKDLLPSIGYNANFYCGDGTLGLPKFAPFDKIIVTAGAPEVPEPLLEQLNTNGNMVIPIGKEGSQKMIRFKKDEQGNYKKENFGDFSFVKLQGKMGW